MKAKKNVNVFGVLLIALSFIFITSCNKDGNEPIQLYYAIYSDKPVPVIDNLVAILYPTAEKTQLLIMGGDGNFIVSNSDDTILKASINEGLIDLTPLATGKVTVTINDQSGNSYSLNVNIAYIENNLVIVKQDVVVIGNKLSAVQKKEIEQKAMLTLPVKVNGGYKFVYKIDNQTNKGLALIYKESYNSQAVESVFEIKQIETDIDGVKRKYRVYVVTIDGKQREFILTRYIPSKTKGDMQVPMALTEVLTEQFKADYPDAELVFTQQCLK